MTMDEGMNSGNLIVDSISTIEITGNITPLSWYRELRLNNGHVDLIGIAILADIVYWYRPSITVNGAGKTIIRKKFKSDLLQRSYAQINERLNLTEDQAKKAVKRLEDGGFIKRHFRTEIHNGTRCANVMYLELIPSRINEITYPIDAGSKGVSVNMQTSICTETDTSLQENRHVSELKQTHPCIEKVTNTKNTSESNSKNSIIDYTSINLIREKFKKQIDYDNLIIDVPMSRELIDQIIEVAVEVLISERDTMKVNGEDQPIAFIKERFSQLNIETMKYVLESLRSHTGGVINKRSFLISTLFNAPATIDMHYQMKVNFDESKIVG